MRINTIQSRVKVSVLTFGLLISILLSACSTAQAPESNDQQGSQSNQQSSQQASQQSNQQSNQPSSSGPIASTEACQAFGGVGGLGLGGGFANFLSSTQGGPTVQANYSASASSDEARDIAEFFEDSLEDALDDDVSAECFWEVNSTQSGVTNRAIYVSLRLPYFPDADDVGNIQNVLSEKGANIIGSSSSTVEGQSYAMVMVSSLPLDLEGQTSGMLMVGEDFAILYAGKGLNQQSPSGAASPTAQSGSSSSSGPVAAPPTTAPAPVSPSSVNSGAIVETLRERFEDTLDVDLVTESNFQSSSSQGIAVVMSFKLQGGDTFPSDAADGLEDVAESLGANVTSKFSSQGTSLVIFEGMDIEGRSASGSFTVAAEQNSLVVSLNVQ